LDATLEEMMTDLWAHNHFENPKAAEEYEDDDFDMEAELAAIEAEADAKAEAQAAAALNNEADWEDVK
jgi:hypothetical protein